MQLNTQREVKNHIMHEGQHIQDYVLGKLIGRELKPIIVDGKIIEPKARPVSPASLFAFVPKPTLAVMLSLSKYF